jgi:hypothetical protein
MMMTTTTMMMMILMYTMYGPVWCVYVPERTKDQCSAPLQHFLVKKGLLLHLHVMLNLQIRVRVRV